MDLKRRLGGGSEEFVSELTDTAGFTHDEARAFIESALPALLESYAWQADTLQVAGLDFETGARGLLSGVRGKALATETGLSAQRTWEGLRALVPAVLRDPDALQPEAPSRGAVGDGAGADESGVLRVDIGFGLSVDGVSETGHPRSTVHETPAAMAHPIFGSLLRLRSEPQS